MIQQATMPWADDARRARCSLVRVLVAMVALATLAATPSAAWAADLVTVITIGESNSPEQVDQLLAYFGVDDPEEVVTVTVDQTLTAMEGIYDLTGVDTAYSSTAFTCGQPGDGITVTTRNIERVTPALYAMALLTAGVDDGELVVAAPDDAPALGMTALTGVFQTWDTAGCGAEPADADRQRYALEQLALVVRIGEALGTPDGVDRVTRMALETQQEMIATGATAPSEIETVIAAQEVSRQQPIPAELRAELIDLLNRIGEADLEWSTFAAGWTLDGMDDGAGIRLQGIAVGGMLETATVPATATAARATPTSTPTPSPTAQPTATAAAPTPTATPAPVTVAGTYADSGGGGVAVEDSGGGAPVAYQIDPAVEVFRAGAAAEVADLVPGDRIQLTYDPVTGRATRIDAEPASVAISDGRPDWVRWLIAAGVGVLALLLALFALAFAQRRRRAAVVPAAVTAPAARIVGVGETVLLGPSAGARSRAMGTMASKVVTRSLVTGFRRVRPVLRGR